MGDLPSPPTPPWERLAVCVDSERGSVNAAIDPAEERRIGPATGVWWHANRIADSVFVDLIDWTDGVRVLARYILRLDGSVELGRWEKGVDPYALAMEEPN